VSFLKLHNDRIPLVQDLYILASQSSQAHSARNHNTYDARSNTLMLAPTPLMLVPTPMTLARI